MKRSHVSHNIKLKTGLRYLCVSYRMCPSHRTARGRDGVASCARRSTLDFEWRVRMTLWVRSLHGAPSSCDVCLVTSQKSVLVKRAVFRAQTHGMLAPVTLTTQRYYKAW